MCCGPGAGGAPDLTNQFLEVAEDFEQR